MGILSSFRFAFQNLFFTPVLYGVIASLAVFSATWEKGDRLKDQLTDHFRNQEDTFDFIIVGGGSAGAVLANRLSESHSVLLLEAGGESHPFQTIPALSLFIPNYPATDWSHKSVTQSTSCLICKEKKYTFSQGKNLGGSGNLNYLTWLRGSPKDYDNWARITGDPRWSYAGVKPAFCASENFVGTTTDTSAHAVGGPLQIEMPSEIGLANEWNWAGQEMGYPHLDLNGQYEEGFDAVYYPIKNGRRIATYKAFIEPVRQRKSLVIRKFAHVNKILIKDATNDAYGVQYDRHGQAKFAFAEKEVVISAGTLQSPKILMLSGIGPAANLIPLHIPVKADLPVGKNLHDHISTLVGPFFTKSSKTFSFDDDVTPASFLEFHRSGKGCLTTSGFQATALLTSAYAKGKNQVGWPDLQLTLVGITPHRLFASDMAHAFGLREDFLNRYFLHTRRKNAFFILVTVARPESRGEMCIASKDPYKPPVIDPKFFSDPGGADIGVMIEGIHRAVFLAENTTTFRKLGTHFTDKCFPGCENFIFRSDAYWECYVRHFTFTLSDSVGTNAMGFQGSPFAVTDSELRVMGVNNLRVVDASVMPTIVGANTQAATIMIAEKGAALLLEKWKGQAKKFGAGPQYGPPPLPGSSPNGQGGSPHPTTVVVVDDAVPILHPPSTDAYQNFDAYNRPHIKNNAIAIGSSPRPPGVLVKIPVSSTFSPTPADLQQSFQYPASPGPETVTQIQNSGYVPIPGEFPTPQIYREVYDPTLLPQTTAQGYYPDQALASSSFSREGKSLNNLSSADETVTEPNSNQLLLDSETSPVTPSGLFSSTTTPTTTFMTRGNKSLIIRRRKRPPNVTVHPRGHLGYEDPTRQPRVLGGPTTASSTSTTSIIPAPREPIVVLRKRRPHPQVRRRQLTSTTTTASTTTTTGKDEKEDDETPSPPIDTTTRRARFVITNSTRVSSSVSAVINRLRSFAPTETPAGSSSSSLPRGKRGYQSTRTIKYNTANKLIQVGDGKKNEKERVVIRTTTELATTVGAKKDTTTSTTTSSSAIIGDNSNNNDDDMTEMIIFSDVEVKNDNDKPQEEPITKKPEEESEEIGSHPFMLMDLDPIPKIIVESSLNSPSSSRSHPTHIKRKRKKRIRN